MRCCLLQDFPQHAVQRRLGALLLQTLPPVLLLAAAAPLVLHPQS